MCLGEGTRKNVCFSNEWVLRARRCICPVFTWPHASCRLPCLAGSLKKEDQQVLCAAERLVKLWLLAAEVFYCFNELKDNFFSDNRQYFYANLSPCCILYHPFIDFPNLLYLFWGHWVARACSGYRWMKSGQCLDRTPVCHRTFYGPVAGKVGHMRPVKLFKLASQTEMNYINNPY